ncbi:MAG: diguanylate cyclase [Tindallia sp. MSAO_Bac2]|nr:MAG: diguanylate cyclase [Tindallia sp. MSAO_Bac2]
MDSRIRFRNSLRFKISLVSFAVVILIMAVMLFRSHRERLELIRMQEEVLNELAVSTIDRRFKVSYEILETGLTQVLANPAIAEAFYQRDRESLEKLVMPSFERLEAVGVCRFHFHLPDQTTFLRVHDPEDYGDDLSTFREIVVSINEDPQRKPIKGIEKGEGGTSLRYISAVYHGGEYAGTVELGMCLGPRILGIFQNVSGGDWFLMQFNEWGARRIHGTDSSPFPISLNEEQLLYLGNGRVLTETDPPYVIQRVPIADFKGDYNYYLKRIFDNSELIGLQQQYTRDSLMFGFSMAIAGSIALWALLRRLLQPLLYLEQKVRRFEAGTLDESIEVTSKDEIAYLARAMEKMRQSIHRREERLKRMSFQDQLTGIHNRHYFDQMINEMEEKKVYPISIIIADVDNLKFINDRIGHAEGDRHIADSAKVLKRAMRQSDLVCRIGGDEFAVLLPGTCEEAVIRIIERIQQEIDLYNEAIENNHRKMEISLGFATCYDDNESLETMMQTADKNMYRNKMKRKKEKASSF